MDTVTVNLLFWQQDGVPAHNAYMFTKHLNNLFLNRQIGNRGPIYLLSGPMPRSFFKDFKS